MDLCDVGEQAATGFLKDPSSGEEEDAETDETQRAAELVENITEVEPRYGRTKGDDAKIHQAAASLADSPPNQKNAKAGDKGVRNDVGFAAGIGSVGVAVVIMLRPDALAPRQANDEGDSGEDRNRRFAQIREREQQWNNSDDAPSLDARLQGRKRAHSVPGVPAVEEEEHADDGGDGRNAK